MGRFRRTATGLLAGACAFACAAASAATCIDGGRVIELRMGNEQGTMGSDDGHAVYVVFDTKVIPLNNGYNNNDPQGQALVKILLTALITGYPVRAYDHLGAPCDDLDEVWIDMPA